MKIKFAYDREELTLTVPDDAFVYESHFPEPEASADQRVFHSMRSERGFCISKSSDQEERQTLEKPLRYFPKGRIAHRFRIGLRNEKTNTKNQ